LKKNAQLFLEHRISYYHSYFNDEYNNITLGERQNKRKYHATYVTN